jgi:hypothetical protein
MDGGGEGWHMLFVRYLPDRKVREVEFHPLSGSSLIDAGLMCPRPLCQRPKILGCLARRTKRLFNIVPLTDVSRPWTSSSMELAPSASGT